MGDEGIPRRLFAKAALLISLLLTSLLVGCSQVQIEARPLETLNSLISSTSDRLLEHDVAVLAIDFDPPLDTLSSFADLRTVSLLVAVENTGLQAERDLTLRVELRIDNREVTPTLSRMATIDKLAPGEVTIVRLEGLSGIPVASEYWLKVRAFPVAGEEDITDNQRIYRIHVGSLTR